MANYTKRGLKFYFHSDRLQVVKEKNILVSASLFNWLHFCNKLTQGQIIHHQNSKTVEKMKFLEHNRNDRFRAPFLPGNPQVVTLSSRRWLHVIYEPEIKQCTMC